MNIPKSTLAPLALLLLAGCGSKTTEAPTAPITTATTPEPLAGKPATTPNVSATPMPKMTPLNAPGAKVDTKKYRVRGVVSGVEKSVGDGRMTLIVNHEDIPQFMPAMEMRLPFAKDEDAAKVKAGEKIAFDLKRSNLEVSNFEMLPTSTQLKLKK